MQALSGCSWFVARVRGGVNEELQLKHEEEGKALQSFVGNMRSYLRYGYQWRDRQWVGPFRGKYQALKAAFDGTIKIMNTERSFAQVNDELWMWNNGWRYIGFQEPESES